MVRAFAIGCLLLVSSVTMAQVDLSVDLSYGNKGYSYMERGLHAFNGELPKGQECYLAPRVGFTVSEGVSVGVRLAARYSSYDFAEGYFDPEVYGWQRSALTTETMVAASAGAYLRIRCANMGRLSLHVEVIGSYGLGWGQDVRKEYRAVDGWEMEMTRRAAQRCVSVQVVPVASYTLGDRVSVDWFLNLAAVTFGSTTVSRWPYRIENGIADEDPESKTVTREFAIGLNSLNTSLITMGVRYCF